MSVDLTHPLRPGMPVWPGHPEFEHELVSCYTRGDASRVFRLGLGEHTGTHLDAPVHWVPGGADIASAPPDVLWGRAAVLHGTSVAELAAFEAAYGPLKPGDRVLIDCGWAARWGSADYFADWPSVSLALARALVERDVRVVAVDTPSPDPVSSVECPVHRLLLGQHILIGENFARLPELSGFVKLLLAPLPIEGGSGSPVRAVAWGA
ncbi:kynurenine formamidase [Amycolatopsis bartoniae]|uniref:Cyclase n=1 Tax=Amycolatopsis bartoniae TaxID=941986 RepID=A0A8H9J167_9PSEU|nr:cyclase family protein [Amycolatopsis bartoniae]MBB2935577.1 kynurenine formamidase [Amycolatopsis bartoniae]TVT05238.1 cyclase family protein [Amycolatopsis bartoniae]GHF76848.1 cyclase [Amycolatopsis bartoniae]